MRIGIITDSHSNPWGQEAVLGLLRKEGIGKADTYDLGDNAGMFPEAVAACDIARAECSFSLLGNHDAVLIGYFEDDPKRWERIAALEENKKKVLVDGREDLFGWLDSLALDRTEEGVYFVHNSPFEPKDLRSREYMIARFGPSMVDPSNPKHDAGKSKLLEISNSPNQIIVRGHAHIPQILKVRRGLEREVEGMVEEIDMKGRDSLDVKIEPDFVYIITVGSTCGANTMFTKDEDLDYRPSGGIIEYDAEKSAGKINLFRTTEGYNVQRFIDSVKRYSAWGRFEEAQRQITHLEHN